MKKSIKILSSIVVLLILASCGAVAGQPSAARKNVPQESLDLSKETPILLIHGSGGDEHSMDDFADNLQKTGLGSKATLTVFVDRNGKLHYQNKLSKNSKPVILIGFEENGDDFNTVEKWATWLQTALRDIKHYYHFGKIDVVGFSNGGLAITTFAEKYGKEKDLPQLNKVVVLGAPFNDTIQSINNGDEKFSSLPKQSAQLQEYIQQQNNLPENISVLAIAGSDKQEDHSDSVVPLRSALAGRLFFPKNVQQYQEEIITSEPAQHVYLLDNQEVIEDIATFLK